jgi:hypothetical protein
MKNTLGDLNNHLFEQLERLNDEDLKDGKLQEEIERAHAIALVASRIISNASLVIEAQKLMSGDKLNADVTLPKMLEG